MDSVFNQSVLPRQVIVVDDGSTDDTAEALESEYGGSIDLFSQPHSGVSRARNRGISESHHDWIAFLDSDDEWCSNKLERQAEFLSQNPQYQICHCDEIWIRHNVRVNPKKYHEKSGGWIFSRCLPLCVISPSAVAINRSVFADIGMFDELMPVCEDYDLWLRISAKYPVGFINEKLVIKHGGHDDQLSQAYPAMDRFRIDALLKLLASRNLTDEYRKSAIEALLEKISIYVEGARKRGRVFEPDAYDNVYQHYQREMIDLA